MVSANPFRRVPRARGFTLLEALMAAGILFVVVLAVTSAIAAGQQHALEAKQRIAASLAAEELLCRLLSMSYDDLATWNGYIENVGAMRDISGNPMPASFSRIGRSVQVSTALKLLPELDVRVRGRTVRVETFDQSGRVLTDLSRFVPEPQS